VSDLDPPHPPQPPHPPHPPRPPRPPLPSWSADSAAASAEAAAQVGAPAAQPSAYPPPHAYPGYPASPTSPAAPGAASARYSAGYSAPYSAPYLAPAGAPAVVRRPAYGGPLAAPSKGGTLGVVAFIAGLLALVVPAVLVSIATYRIGLGAGREIAAAPMSVDFDWSILSPVRDWVLLGESAFWVGTALGLWALVQGIVALVTNRGRGAGLVAVVLAIVAPIAFVVAANVFLTMGLAAGAGFGG
jgi:hypothetical protein